MTTRWLAKKVEAHVHHSRALDDRKQSHHDLAKTKNVVAAIHIQAAWRGYSVRTTHPHGQCITKARRTRRDEPAQMLADEQRIRTWVVDAQPGDTLTFRASKIRRRNVYRVCIRKTVEAGVKIQHRTTFAVEGQDLKTIELIMDSNPRDEVNERANTTMKILRNGSAGGERTDAQTEELMRWINSIAFFQKSTPNAERRRRLCSIFELKEYGRGELIITQGDLGNTFYVILEGHLEFIINSHAVGVLSVGCTFGDRALTSEDQPRGATVRTVGGCVLAVLHGDAYRKIVGDHAPYMLDEFTERKHDTDSTTYDWVVRCSNETSMGADPLLGKPERRVQQLMAKMLDAGLILHAVTSLDTKHWYIQITAPETVLLYWATKMKLKMRLTPAVHHNDGRHPSMPKNHQCQSFSGVVPFKESLIDEFQLSPIKKDGGTFCSGERQQIIRYILENQRHGFVSLQTSVLAADAFARRSVLKGFEAIVTGVAGALGHAADRIADNVAHGAEKLNHAIISTVDSMQEGAHNHDSADSVSNPLNAAAMIAPSAMIARTAARRAIRTKELGEVGSEWDDTRIWPCIKKFYPLHDEHELKFLVSEWANINLAGRHFHPKRLTSNILQPIDDVRDYFGDQIGMYFAFLRVYTESLRWPAFVGLVTIIGHVRDGVEGNPLS